MRMYQPGPRRQERPDRGEPGGSPR